MYPISAAPVRLYGRALSRLFFPEICPLCGICLRTWEYQVCGSCEALLSELREPLCLSCADELPAFSGLSLCGHCSRSRHDIDRVWSLFTYNDAFKKIIHRVKFCGKPALLRVFESRLDDFLRGTDWPSFDAIVPVPMDRLKLWTRGFNQSYLLSLMAGKTLQLTVNRDLLKKKFTDAPQSALAKDKRLSNVAGTFKVTDPEWAQNRDILLVDDIYTTGATVNECAKVLKQAGAASVCAFALARVGRNNS